jgi:hypothetical protein
MVRCVRWLGIFACVILGGCLLLAGAPLSAAGRPRYPDLRGSWLGTLRYAASGREESVWLSVVDQVPPAPGSRSARFFGGVLSEGVFGVDSIVDGGGTIAPGGDVDGTFGQVRPEVGRPSYHFLSFAGGRVSQDGMRITGTFREDRQEDGERDSAGGTFILYRPRR